MPSRRFGFVYCLLPSAPSRLRSYFDIQCEGMQGSCGRGLVSRVAVPAGEAIFDEPPLVVAYKSTKSPQEHHSERWVAYATLLSNANANAKNSAALKVALAAFDDLCSGEHVPEHVRLGAAYITAKQLEDAGRSSGESSIPPEQLAAFAQQCTGVLMRFQSNQFTFQNNAPAGDPSFFASAVYAFTSRVNHSCAPSMGMVSKELYCKQHRITFTVEEAGGVLLAYSKRDLKAGERLTFNYGPDELVGWGLNERRAFLWERLNFVCGCERCEAEAAAVESAEEIEEIDPEVEGDDAVAVAGETLAEKVVEEPPDGTEGEATAQVAATGAIVADVGRPAAAGGKVLPEQVSRPRLAAAAGASAIVLMAVVVVVAVAARRTRT